jgi:hypothetical protein
VRSRSLALLALLALLLLASPALAERGEHEEFRNEKVLRLEAFEAQHGYPAKARLRGRTMAGYRFSEALLVRPDGSAVPLDEVELDESRQDFVVTCRLDRGKGIYRLDLTARTGKRTHTGARVLLFAGVPTDHPDEPPPEDVKPDLRLPGVVIAGDLFERVNGHRERLGLKRVEWFEPLAVVLREHAADCVALGKLDHSVNGEGTVVDRLASRYGWTPLAYYRPNTPPSRRPDAKSCFPTMVEARRGIEPVLHRWQRFASFCVPMTSPLVTHGACAVARTSGGSCYIVFTFAQVNGIDIPRDAKDMAKRARDAVRHAGDEDRPARLRALGSWRDKTAVREARKHLRAKDAALRGAAHDVLLLSDPKGQAREIERSIRRIREAFERLVEAPGRPKAADHLELGGIRALTYAPRLLDLASEAETVRARAAEAAWASLPTTGEARSEALRRLAADWPATQAARRAAAELDG